MKKYKSALEIVGLVLLIISTVAFLVSLIACYIGEIKAVITIMASLILFFISYILYNKGKRVTERHFGNDNRNKAEDENIYKDTVKKD